MPAALGRTRKPNGTTSNHPKKPRSAARRAVHPEEPKQKLAPLALTAAHSAGNKRNPFPRKSAARSPCPTSQAGSRKPKHTTRPASTPTPTAATVERRCSLLMVRARDRKRSLLRLPPSAFSSSSARSLVSRDRRWLTRPGVSIVPAPRPSHCQPELTE